MTTMTNKKRFVPKISNEVLAIFVNRKNWFRQRKLNWMDNDAFFGTKYEDNKYYQTSMIRMYNKPHEYDPDLLPKGMDVNVRVVFRDGTIRDIIGKVKTHTIEDLYEELTVFGSVSVS